jgi:hypothetical protein
MRNFYQRCASWLKSNFLDVLGRILYPIFNSLTIIFAFILNYDFLILKNNYPDWRGIFNIAESPTIFWLFIAFAVLSALTSVSEWRRKKSLRQLSNQIASLKEQNEVISENIKNLFDGVLYNLSKKLDFTERDQSRISLYIHDKKQSFVPFGRYSPNPEFQKPGRSYYPDRQGCISRGWQHGWHFENTFGDTPHAHKKKNTNDYHIPVEVYGNLKMKSYVYAVKRLNDKNGDSLAVIVVESTQKDRFTESELQERLNGTVEDFSHMIKALKDYIPTPDNANEQGF